MTVIAFIGSVFSPYYAWARQRGTADPLNHCAVNVSLYGPRGGRWAMTERGGGALSRDAEHLHIGPSALRWDGECLSVGIDEVTVPRPSRLRGRLRLYPEALTGRKLALDRAARHHWWPVAPRARVELDFQQPALCWRGSGYFDSNAGAEALEQSFVGWHWSRAHLSKGAALLYNARERGGATTSLALQVAGDGSVEPFPSPPEAALPPTLWRIERRTRADPSVTPQILRTLQDSPFYARSLVASRVRGEDVTAVHESLDLNRFRHPLVQLMLPFRMPRRS